VAFFVAHTLDNSPRFLPPLVLPIYPATPRRSPLVSPPCVSSVVTAYRLAALVALRLAALVGSVGACGVRCGVRAARVFLCFCS